MQKVRNSSAGIALLVVTAQAFPVFAAVPLDPLTIPKFVTPFEVPPAFTPMLLTDPVT